MREDDDPAARYVRAVDRADKIRKKLEAMGDSVSKVAERLTDKLEEVDREVAECRAEILSARKPVRRGPGLVRIRDDDDHDDDAR